MKHQDAFEAAVAASATKAMYGGAGAAAGGFVMSNELLGVLGLLIALMGFAVNFYYRRKQDQREVLEHERRMRLIITKPAEFGEQGADD